MKDALGFSGEELKNITFKCHLVGEHINKSGHEVIAIQTNTHSDRKTSFQCPLYIVYWIVLYELDFNASEDLCYLDLVIGIPEGFHDPTNFQNTQCNLGRTS